MIFFQIKYLSILLLKEYEGLGRPNFLLFLVLYSFQKVLIVLSFNPIYFLLALFLIQLKQVLFYLYSLIMNGGNTNEYLETLWKNSQSQQMQVTPPIAKGVVRIWHSCKLIKKQLMLRTSRFALYRGIERFREISDDNNKQGGATVNFKDVVIKKYQQTSRDRNHDPSTLQPKQNEILKRITNPNDKPRAFFSFNKEYYLVLSQMDHTLYDKIKYGVRQWRELKELKELRNLKAQFIHHFLTQIIGELLSLHEKKQFLGGLRPTYIGVLDKFEGQDKKIYTYKITDWSLANIQPKTQQRLREYDLAYIAPEYKQQLGCKSDIWSVGCILYQIMSCGQKLIQDLNFHSLQIKEKQEFIQQRLDQLVFRIDLSNNTAKYKCAQLSPEIVTFLRNLLEINPSKRIASDELKNRLKGDKQFILQANTPRPNFSPAQANFFQGKIIYDISMEIFRLSSIQDSIMTIFEQLYFNKDKTVTKYHLYPLLKFASCYYMEAYSKLKDKSRCFAKNEKYDKYSQVKRIQDERKLTDIRDKAGPKMIKDMEQQKQFEKKKTVLRNFPEIKDQKVFYTRDLFNAYLDYVKEDLCKKQNQKFYKPLLSIHFYMLELPEMQDYLRDQLGQKILLKLTREQLEQNKDPEIVYFHKVNLIPDVVDKRMASIFVSRHQKGSEKERQQIEGNMKAYLESALRNK